MKRRGAWLNVRCRGKINEQKKKKKKKKKKKIAKSRQMQTNHICPTFIDDSFNLEYLVCHSLLILQDANIFRT